MRLTQFLLVLIVAFSCFALLPLSKSCAIGRDDPIPMEHFNDVHMRPTEESISKETSEKLLQEKKQEKENVKTVFQRLNDLFEISSYKESANGKFSRNLVNKTLEKSENKPDMKIIDGTEPQKYNDDSSNESRRIDDDESESNHDMGKNDTALKKKLEDNTEKLYQFSKSLIRNPNFVDNRPEPSKPPRGKVSTAGQGSASVDNKQRAETLNKADALDESEDDFDYEDDSDDSDDDDDDDEFEDNTDEHDDHEDEKRSGPMNMDRQQPSTLFAPRVENIGFGRVKTTEEPYTEYIMEIDDYPDRAPGPMPPEPFRHFGSKQPSHSRHRITNDNYPNFRSPTQRTPTKNSDYYDDVEYNDDSATNEAAPAPTKNNKVVRGGFW